jgi:hypothetical protein
MTGSHFTPESVERIVTENRITIRELAHLRSSTHCNGWLRAFAAVTSARRQKTLIWI